MVRILAGPLGQAAMTAGIYMFVPEAPPPQVEGPQQLQMEAAKWAEETTFSSASLRLSLCTPSASDSKRLSFLLCLNRLKKLLQLFLPVIVVTWKESGNKALGREASQLLLRPGAVLQGVCKRSLCWLILPATWQSVSGARGSGKRVKESQVSAVPHQGNITQCEMGTGR